MIANPLSLGSLLRRVAGALAMLLVFQSGLPSSANAQSGTVLASDDFDRPDETPLAVGGDWQKATGAGVVDLSSNAIAGQSGDAIYFWQGTGTFDDAQQFARARVVQTTGQIGLSLLASADQAIVVAWSRAVSTVFIYWYSGGILRGTLATATSNVEVDDEIEAVLLAGRIYAKVNGTIVAAATNTTTLTTGRPGFEASGAGGRLDDWEAGTPDAFTIGGTIQDGAAAPVEGALVRASGLFGAVTTTNASGQYAIANVPHGLTNLRLTPTLTGQTMSPPQRLVVGPITTNVAGEDFTATASSNNVIASDDFDRPNELPLQVGGPWQKAAGGANALLSGNAIAGVNDDAVYFWQGPGTFDDARQFARARVTATAGQVGLSLLGGNGQAIVVAWNRALSTLYIYWYSSGILRANLTTATSTIEVGDVIEADLLGGRIYAKVNGTIVASATNTTTLTTGRPGFEASGAGGGLDDWEAGTPVTYSVSGTILDGSAAPIEGALVRASGLFGATTATDSSGQYAFTDVPQGATSLRIKPTFAGYTMGPIQRIVAGPIFANVAAQDFTATASNNNVVADDDFDRPNELPLQVGGPWQKAAGAANALLSGNAIAGVNDDAVYFWQGPGTFDDARQFARARVTATAGQVGLSLLGGNGQAIVVAWNDSLSTLFIYWYSSGILRANLTTATSTIEVGDLIEADLLGGRIYAKVNGTIVASATNTTTLTTGRPGFEASGAGGGLDDWEAGTPVSYSVSGTILDGAAAPIEGALVRASGLFGATTATDSSGQYAFTDVPQGATNLRIKPTRAGYAMTPLERQVAGPITTNIVGQDFTAAVANNPLVASDDFDRPNELPLQVGGPWQKAAGGGNALLSGNAIAGVNDDAIYFWQGPGTFDDTRQFARARVTSTAGQVGLSLLAGNGQAIVVAWNDSLSTLFIYWYSSGVPRGNLTTATATIEVGDVIEAVLLSGQIEARVNGTLVASIANTTTLSTGRPGFEVSGFGGDLDDWSAGLPQVACDDGQDNDGDLLVDLADPGCANAADVSEQNPALVCDDGLDNDGDGLVDLADPGCANGIDPSEQNASAACDDGLDNDGDQLVDLADPGCTNGTDPSEQNAAVACDDGQDNDGDQLIDLADPGCANAADASEQNVNAACDDGLDNDGDDLIDLADPGCTNGSDPSEQNAAVACDDGLDNDGDTLVDLDDPGCSSANDASEQDASVECDDGIDNDGDLATDWPADPDCENASDPSETGAPTAVPMLPPVGIALLAIALVSTAGWGIGSSVRRRKQT